VSAGVADNMAEEGLQNCPIRAKTGKSQKYLSDCT